MDHKGVLRHATVTVGQAGSVVVIDLDEEHPLLALVERAAAPEHRLKGRASGAALPHVAVRQQLAAKREQIAVFENVVLGVPADVDAELIGFMRAWGSDVDPEAPDGTRYAILNTAIVGGSVLPTTAMRQWTDSEYAAWCDALVVYRHNTCNGGALEIYADEHSDPLMTINTHAAPGQKRAILISGSIWRGVSTIGNIQGPGCREAFVFQAARAPH